MQFKDSSMVITGAGSGIGAATARAAAAKGAKVCVSDLDGGKAKAVAAEIGGMAVQCDLRAQAAVHNLVN